MRTRLLEIDLVDRPSRLTGLGAHDRVRVLVRLAGMPVGIVEAAVCDGEASLDEIGHKAFGAL